MFTPILGEIIQFDEHIFRVETTNQFSLCFSIHLFIGVICVHQVSWWLGEATPTLFDE